MCTIEQRNRDKDPCMHTIAPRRDAGIRLKSLRSRLWASELMKTGMVRRALSGMSGKGVMEGKRRSG